MKNYVDINNSKTEAVIFIQDAAVDIHKMHVEFKKLEFKRIYGKK